MDKFNYYLKYQDIVKGLDQNSKPKILVQACCGPCSTQVLNELKQYFDITLYYYNPNIYPFEEFEKRYEQFCLIPNAKVIRGEYEENKFIDSISNVKDFALLKEGSERCYYCYKFRLEETAKKAKLDGYDFFTTTLSISPYKNSDWINELGEDLEKKYGIKFLYSDFKKKDGYKKSIAFSKEYGLYRQEYCGCKYSLEESLTTKKNENSK